MREEREEDREGERDGERRRERYVRKTRASVRLISQERLHE